MGQLRLLGRGESGTFVTSRERENGTAVASREMGKRDSCGFSGEGKAGQLWLLGRGESRKGWIAVILMRGGVEVVIAASAVRTTGLYTCRKHINCRPASTQLAKEKTLSVLYPPTPLPSINLDLAGWGRTGQQASHVTNMTMGRRG